MTKAVSASRTDSTETFQPPGHAPLESLKANATLAPMMHREKVPPPSPLPKAPTIQEPQPAQRRTRKRELRVSCKQTGGWCAASRHMSSKLVANCEPQTQTKCPSRLL